LNGIPTRKENAYLAEIVLKQEKYDLFLFIEDEKLNVMYEIIVNKIFNKTVTIGKIFPMNSKKNVLLQFEKWKSIEKRTKNKVAFIVDRDYDHLKGEQVPNHNNLIQHEYYTIENYLISKEGAMSLMKHRMQSYDPEQLDEKLNWDWWMRYTFLEFEKLFLSYAVAFKYDLRSNCSISPHRYLANGGYQIIPEQIQSYIESVEELFSEKNDLSIGEAYQEVQEYFLNEGETNYHQLISGKYLVEALIKYVSSISVNTVVDKDLIKTNLLHEYPIEKLSFFKNRIENILLV